MFRYSGSSGGGKRSRGEGGDDGGECETSDLLGKVGVVAKKVKTNPEKGDEESCDDNGNGGDRNGNSNRSSRANSPVPATDDENNAVLSKIMRSGISGVIDHDLTDSSSTKSTRMRNMEDEAKRMAREAVNNLRRAGRSGNGNGNGSGNGSGNGNVRGGSKIDYGRAGNSSSMSLLGSIQRRNDDVAYNEYSGGPAPSRSLTRADKKFDIVARKLREFIRRHGGSHAAYGGGGPTTKQIIDQFGGFYKDNEAAIFKNLLNSIATMSKTTKRWCLKEAFW